MTNRQNVSVLFIRAVDGFTITGFNRGEVGFFDAADATRLIDAGLGVACRPDLADDEVNLVRVLAGQPDLGG